MQAFGGPPGKPRANPGPPGPDLHFESDELSSRFADATQRIRNIIASARKTLTTQFVKRKRNILFEAYLSSELVETTVVETVLRVSKQTKRIESDNKKYKL